MNALESNIFVFCIIVVFLYLSQRLNNIKQAIPLTLLSLLPLYLSLEGATQFLTMDGSVLIREPLNLKDIPLDQWNIGALRTTDLLLGPILQYTNKLSWMTYPMSKMWAKALHWLCGFCLLLVILDVISKHYISKHTRPYFFLSYFYSAFLLPTNVLALKVFNYDLLSMLLAIWAMLCMLLAIQKHDVLYSFQSLVLAALAAQEKLNASPIFLLSAFVFSAVGFLYIKNVPLYLKLTLCMVAPLSTGIAIGWLSGAVIGTIRGNLFPFMNLFSLSLPLFDWVWPFLNLIYAHAWHSQLQIHFALLFPATILCNVFLLCFVHFVFVRKTAARCVSKFYEILKKFFVAFVPAVFITGVIGTFLVNVYYAPFSPIPEGYYHPQVGRHGMTVGYIEITEHFHSRSAFGHMANSVLHSVSVFVTALPTIHWITLFLMSFFYLKSRPRGANHLLQEWELIVFATLLSPFLFGIAQIPAGSRYFNIFLFSLLIAILIKMDVFLQGMNATKKVALTGCFILLFTLEAIPFRPLYAAFRPVWCNYPEKYNEFPVVGQANGTWLGWGEELFLLGTKINALYEGKKVDRGKIHVYVNSLGEWLNAPVQTFYFIPYHMRYTEHDYYIVKRSAIAQNETKFPWKCKPLLTLSYRGFTQAWVFRGDHLKQVGFAF